MVFDNSEAWTELIAAMAKGAEIIVFKSVKFAQLIKYSHANAQKKIMDGKEKVYENLIAYKRKMNSELVVFRANKIVTIKP